MLGRSIRCVLGFHDHRDPATGWPRPDWWSIIRPHRYVCTRCGDVFVLYPEGER